MDINKQFEIALATRNFEIELFWKRSIFFWGFIASAFVGYAALQEKNFGSSILLACFGLVCSIAWSAVNRGSKRWQENWENLVAELEEEGAVSLFRERRVKNGNKGWLSARKFSVSKVTIALSDFTILVWLSLLVAGFVKSFPLTLGIHGYFYVALAIVGSLAFSVAMLLCGRSSD